MAINTIQTASVFQKQLDQVAVRDAVTGWMDANAGQVIYNGGAEVKIPKLAVQGMADYDRENGYVQGAVTFDYETRKMEQDRGRKFELDAMYVDETNFVATAAAIMAEFQRDYVIPEIDAYRLSSLATTAISASVSGMVQYGYKPGATGTSALRKVKEGITAVRYLGYNGPLVVHATDEFIMELELEMAAQLRNTDFSKGGVKTIVPEVDGVPVIPTPANRMYTAIELNDGTTGGQEVGGYKKGTSAKDMNFIVMPRITPLAVTKQDKMRIFTPDDYQKSNAWSMDYRRFHDIWVLDNKKDSLYVSIKDGE